MLLVKLFYVPDNKITPGTLTHIELHRDCVNLYIHGLGFNVVYLYMDIRKLVNASVTTYSFTKELSYHKQLKLSSFPSKIHHFKNHQMALDWIKTSVSYRLQTSTLKHPQEYLKQACACALTDEI